MRRILATSAAAELQIIYEQFTISLMCPVLRGDLLSNYYLLHSSSILFIQFPHILMATVNVPNWNIHRQTI